MPAATFHREYTGKRASPSTMRQVHHALKAIPEAQRTFEHCQTIARALKVNGQIVWRVAGLLGAPSRNPGKVRRIMTEARVLEAEARLARGEPLKAIADSMGTFPTTITNRLERLREEREDAAMLQPPPRAPAKPNVYLSPFLRPLTAGDLCVGKARPTATRPDPISPFPP